MSSCPNCEEIMGDKDKVCKKCGHDVFAHFVNLINDNCVELKKQYSKIYRHLKKIELEYSDKHAEYDSDKYFKKHYNHQKMIDVMNIIPDTNSATCIDIVCIARSIQAGFMEFLYPTKLNKNMRLGDFCRNEIVYKYYHAVLQDEVMNRPY